MKCNYMIPRRHQSKCTSSDLGPALRVLCNVQSAPCLHKEISKLDNEAKLAAVVVPAKKKIVK